MRLLILASALVLAGCVAPTSQSGIAQRIGAFEVGRYPGETMGVYGAVTTSGGNMFSRSCSLGTCRWSAVSVTSKCEKRAPYAVIFSIDNRASSQMATCVDFPPNPQGSKGSVYMFLEDDAKLTAMLLQGKQVGITMPDGISTVFSLNGVEAAVKAVERVARSPAP